MCSVFVFFWGGGCVCKKGKEEKLRKDRERRKRVRERKRKRGKKMTEDKKREESHAWELNKVSLFFPVFPNMGIKLDIYYTLNQHQYNPTKCMAFSAKPLVLNII